jgi:hypothetical protein
MAGERGRESVRKERKRKRKKEKKQSEMGYL